MKEFAPRFTFKRFAVDDRRCAMKVGTDGVLLGAWAELGDSDYAEVADMGAGSGLIALMIAQRYDNALIIAAEIDPEAFSDLEKNIQNSDFAERIRAVCGDYSEVSGKFDLIVSNPPFYTAGVSCPDSSRALAREAGSLSPVGLIEYASRHLKPAGNLAMIAPSDLDSEIEFQSAIHKLNVSRRCEVATSSRRGVTRTLWELTPAPCAMAERKMLAVGSEEYKELTADFYLNN